MTSQLINAKTLKKRNRNVVPWCSVYHYYTISFDKVWNQVLGQFKTYSRRVGDLRWWERRTMAPARTKIVRLSLINHFTKTIHHQHSVFRYFLGSLLCSFLPLFFSFAFMTYITTYRYLKSSFRHVVIAITSSRYNTSRKNFLV